MNDNNTTYQHTFIMLNIILCNKWMIEYTRGEIL